MCIILVENTSINISKGTTIPLKTLLFLCMCFRYPLVFFLGLVCCLWSCEKRPVRTGNLVDYIPKNSELVVKFANLETTKNDLNGSALYGELKGADILDFLKSERRFLDYFQPKSESVLCLQPWLDSIQHFTMITRFGPEVFELDSIVGAVSSRKTYEGYEILETRLDSKSRFSAIVDSTFIASSSEVILKSIIDGDTETQPLFKKTFSLDSKDGLVMLMRSDSLQINDSLSINLASRVALELDIYPDGIHGSGIALDRDTVSQLLSIFRGLHPQKNQSPGMIPVKALQAQAITYDDAQILEKNLQRYHGSNLVLDPLFGSIDEIAGIHLNEGKAVILKSIDPESTLDEFSRFINEAGSFREVTLFEFEADIPLFDSFYPLIFELEPSIAFQIEDFFVTAENQTVAEQIITSFKNNNTLENASFYENTSLRMSEASSFVVYNLQGAIDGWTAPFLSADAGPVKNFPLSVFQMSYDRDFGHLNIVCKEASKAQVSSGSITQLFSKQLDHSIMGGPWFFSNHRTRGKDIVLQDIQNNLYLLSASGKLLWKKTVNGPILGDMQEVDLLRNGKKQLAFVTDKSFYILDRNGKSVAPFPKKFKDKITQPLSVFDYDNKRNYRFVVVQGDDVLMYDSRGKTVSGFTFNKAGSKVVLPPQHLRMGNKDYILVAEESGKLNILSRRGKERVKVNKSFNFSEMPIAREGLNFVVITKEFIKESISQSGKVTSKKLNVSSNYWFSIRGNTKVTLDDNLLRVNGKLVELPFGIYTPPRIFVSNRKTYITICETQEKKVYVLDKAGTILKGFPIYGNGMPALGDAKNNRKNAVVVTGSDSEVILYGID